MRLLPLMFTTAALLAATAPCTAASIVLDGTGHLIGANGVSVQGQLYDVEFRDGTCAGLFQGCDSTDDFVFNTQASAYAASLALLNQVINAHASVDLNPTVTRGCETAIVLFQGQRMDLCWALTPIAPTQPGFVATYVAANDIRDAFDSVPVNTNLVLGTTQDLSGTVQSGVAWHSTWAVWRAAGSGPGGDPGRLPEPGSATLALAALALVAGLRRR